MVKGSSVAGLCRGSDLAVGMAGTRKASADSAPATTEATSREGDSIWPMSLE
ncbi:MAG: hypothetical protein ACPIOQ_27605 [Promethearchaeia archaeon]